MERAKTLKASIPFMNLPNDIYVSIFLKLPFDSIIICRHVCKQWLRLLSDPNFARIYQNHYPIRTPKIIYRRFKSECFYSVDIEATADNSNNQILKLPVLLKLPVKNYGYSRIYGSCNGLLCIDIYQNAEGPYDKSIILRNPSTGDYRMLPDANPPLNDGGTESLVGFGYDSFSEDYKIVRIFLGRRCQFDLFSLKTNSWKVIESPKQLIRFGFCKDADAVGTTINETIYWLLWDTPNFGKIKRWIVGFDLKHHKFIEGQLPPCRHHVPDFWDFEKFSLEGVKLMAIGICLGLCCSYRSQVHDTLFIMWTMKENKWSKLITISNDVIENNWIFEMLKPLCFFEDGRKILFQIEPYADFVTGLVVYDTKVNGIIKTIQFEHILTKDSVVYTETLVSPNVWVA